MRKNKSTVLIPKPGKLLVELPCDNIPAVRDVFLKRVSSDLTPDERSALQGEFELAVVAHRKEVQEQREAAIAYNVAAFLKDPKAVLLELREEAGQKWDVGESLLWTGIARIVRSTRFGKGTKIGQGTIGEQTISTFRVTVRIGDKEAIIISGSGNDRRAKARMEADCAHALATKIANGETW